LFFFAAIFPTMGVIGFTDSIAANRFVYLPSIGFLLILSWTFSRIWQSNEISGRLRPRRAAVFVAVAILGVLEIISSRSYLGHWQDSESHFRHMLALAPQSGKLNYNLGLVLAGQQKDDEATLYFLQALRLNPNFQEAHNNLGIMLAKRGDLDGAIGHFVRAIELKPTNDRAHHNLAETLFSKGDTAGAIKHYRESLRLKPESPYTLNDLSWILATDKKLEFREGTEAVRLAKRACELTNYGNPEMLDTLAAAYAESSNFTEAVKIAQKAIDLYISSGKQKQAEDTVARQQLYKAGQPYRAD